MDKKTSINTQGIIKSKKLNHATEEKFLMNELKVGIIFEWVGEGTLVWVFEVRSILVY